MNEFILLFRANYQNILNVSAEEMHKRNDRWMDWIDDLEAKNQLAEGGNHLSASGKVLRAHGEMTDGVFCEINE